MLWGQDRAALLRKFLGQEVERYMDTPGSLVVCSRIWLLELGQPFVGKAGFEASAADDIGQKASGDWGIPLSPGGIRACGKAAQLDG